MLLFVLAGAKYESKTLHEEFQYQCSPVAAQKMIKEVSGLQLY